MKTTVRVLRRGTTLATAARLRAHAAASGMRLTVRIEPGARLGSGVLFECEGQGSASLTIERGAVVQSGALLRITGGGRIHIGPSTQVRRYAILNVAGLLDLRGDNLISWGSIVHCAEQVVFDEMAGTGEGVSIVDGAHYRLGDDDHWYHRSKTAPIHVGRNVWLASKCLVSRGVTIGDASTVAAGSVVTTDVPPRCLVAGAPARIVRRHINTALSRTL